MNPDQPQNPREELEIKITALLLGELDPAEETRVREAIAADAELRKLHDELSRTIDLVQAAAQSSTSVDQPHPAEPLRLSEGKRDALLAKFKTVRFTPVKPSATPRVGIRLVELAAVIAIVAILAAMLLPSLGKAKSKAQRISVLNNLKQVELAKQMWAEDHGASPDAAPTTEDLKPYLNDNWLQPVEGETYRLGTVSEPAVAEFTPDVAGKKLRGLERVEGTDGRNLYVMTAPSFARPKRPANVTPLPGPRVITEFELVPPPPAPSPSETPASQDSLYAGIPVSTAGRSSVAIALPSGSEDRDADDSYQTVTATMGSEWGLAGGMAGNELKQAGQQADRFGRFGAKDVEEASRGSSFNRAAGRDAGGLAVGVTDGAAELFDVPAPTLGYAAFAPGAVPPSSAAPATPEQPQRLAKGVTATRSFEAENAPALGQPATLGDLAATGGGGGAGGLVNQPRGGTRIDRGAPVTSSSAAAVAGAEGEQVRFDPTTGLPLARDDSKATVAKGVRSDGGESADSRARIALNYASPANVASAIRQTAPNSRVDITADGQLSIEETPEDLASVEGMVRQIDAPTRQVLIEARLMEGRDKLESTGEPVAAGAYAADAIASAGEREAGLQVGRGYFSFGAPRQRIALTERKLEELKTRREVLERSEEAALGAQLAEIEEHIEVAEAELDILSRLGESSRLALYRSADPSDPAPARKPSPDAPTPQPEILTTVNPFSTFSLNVSDVSFKLAAASLEQGQMPDTASIRSEEFINAFNYRDPAPAPGQPLAFAWERARYPFAHNRDLMRFSVQTAARGREPGRPLNLVLLLDNSGSMERADRVSIIRECLNVLAGQLTPQDKVSVVTFARTARLWVDGVPGVQAPASLATAGGLTPEGGTNLEEAMNLAYATAHRHYLADGVNRVVLLTDGAANLGNVEPESLKAQVEAQRKQGIALDCFGIGWEGYNDDLLEVLSRNGDGRYGFVNTPQAASSEFAAQLAGALQVAASDVKVQVEFNPARVTAYRQIGYAKHQLTKEQFRDNTVDAAEIGAAESGNALYVVQTNPNGQGPIGTVRARFKVPTTGEYKEYAWTVPYNGEALGLDAASPTMRLAGTASAFSEWLAASPYAGDVSPERLLGLLRGVPGVFGADPRPTQLETMIREAGRLAGN